MKWKETMKKRQSAALAASLLGLSLLLSGCVQQIREREAQDLSDLAIEAPVEVPAQDGVAGREEWVTLYFLSEDGDRLVPVTRRVTVEGGVSRARAALDALLSGPQDGETGAYWTTLSGARSERLLEVSMGVATVDLPAHARTLPQETLYAVRQAIANTLTEFSEISYVNVLVGGREEGLDLSATLPVGTLTHVDDLDAGARYARLYDQRQSGGGITVMTTLYFPARDAPLLLPEVRNVTYAQVSPIEYLYTLLGEMGKGAGLSLCAQDVPAPLDYIEEMPEIVRTQDGYLAIELQLNREIEAAVEAAGLTLEVYMAMLTDTLMGFVPGVEGLKVTIDGEHAMAVVREADGGGAELAMRGDFAACAGAPATLYVAQGEGLGRVQRILPQGSAHDARERLVMLMQEADTLPAGLTGADVLAVYVGNETIAVNLSENARARLAALTPERERVAVYAMVNTLTEDTNAQAVAFFFEGEQVAALTGELEMRGVFLRNPGMVVD